MARYFPISSPIAFKASHSGLSSLSWKDRALLAEFWLGRGIDKTLRVNFVQTDIVRIVDDMALSTEGEPVADEGLVEEHFAYEVKDSRFWRAQSDVWFDTNRDAKHYRFVTGAMCLDVIARDTPSFTILPPDGAN